MSESGQPPAHLGRPVNHRRHKITVLAAACGEVRRRDATNCLRLEIVAAAHDGSIHEPGTIVAKSAPT